MQTDREHHASHSHWEYFDHVDPEREQRRSTLLVAVTSANEGGIIWKNEPQFRQYIEGTGRLIMLAPAQQIRSLARLSCSVAMKRIWKNAMLRLFFGCLNCYAPSPTIDSLFYLIDGRWS
jgi:hypothetical protein